MAFATIDWPDTGELTRQILIRRWLDVPTPILPGIEQTFDLGLKCWAKIKPVRGVLYWMGKQIDNEIDHIFWVRYYDGTKATQITGEHIVEFNGRRFRVKRATDVEGAKAFTMIETTELGIIPTPTFTVDSAVNDGFNP